MGFRPCVSCGRKFFGQSDYTYVTWWAGEEKFNFRLVQCGGCASELRNSASSSGDARRGDEWELAEQQLDLHQVVQLQSAAPAGASPSVRGGAGGPINVEGSAEVASGRSKRAAG
jgi:hypothetical protein